MVLQGGSDLNLKGPRNKKKKMVDTSNWRPWSELHEVLLHLIANQLGAIDYLMFGCVCKGWRLYVAAHRKEYWHPNHHFLSSYQHKLRELVISTASLTEGCTRQYCRALLAKHVPVFLVGT